MDFTKDRANMPPAPGSNPDPITKEPGSHPVGTGAGAAGGAAAGAAVGAAVGGPVGAVVGGAAGAIVGGAAGHAAGEAVNPTVEDTYWQENYKDRSYVTPGKTYSDYRPAYRYGWEAAGRDENRSKRFEEIEGELERGWDKARGGATTAWVDAREATRDAWNRVRGGN
jgi:phage tail tape-measure protein